MSVQQQFLKENQKGIEEYRIRNEKEIPSPSFMPEVKSPEDLHAILQHLDALEDNNPVIVPGYRWPAIQTKPAFSKYQTRMRRLMSMPLLYYEPPELFRYTMPDRLVTYALKGSRSKRIDFNKKLRAGDLDGAVEELPTFFQPFVDRQRESLVKNYEEAPDASEVQDNGKVPEGWGDPRADRGYKDYFRELVQNAKDAENAHVVPPVPVIQKSSRDVAIRRMKGFNRAMARTCRPTQFGFGSPVYPYYHVYADVSILDRNTDNDREILRALQNDLGAPDHDFAGVVITLTGYETAWSGNSSNALLDFIEEAASIAKRHQMPIHLPRSNWYGARLTDVGVNSFGALMNGKERYEPRGGGMKKENRHYRYGKVATYEIAQNLDIEEFDRLLQHNGGEVTQIDGLPSQPPIYNPKGASFKDKYGKARDFRINFGKPRRLLHAQEAREFRDGIERGLMKPATRYFERGHHKYIA